MDLFERVLERVLEWLSLSSHLPLSQLLVVGLIIFMGLVFVLMRSRRRQRGPAHDGWIDGIEERVTAKPQTLMNDAEVSMFNLLLLAVRDHFLLLSKIPLRNLLHLRVEDDAFKRVVAQNLRNVTVDFVLVHPGTRLPVKVVFLEKPDEETAASPEREWLVEALFLKAGVALIWLDQEARYSVEQLTYLLGLEEEA